MSSVYVKIFFAALIAAIISFFSYRYIFFSTAYKTTSISNRILSDLNFDLINHLIETKSDLTLKNNPFLLNDELNQHITLVNINDLMLTDEQKNKLLDGEIVYQIEENYDFLTYTLNNVFAYKRIKTTKQVVKIDVGVTLLNLIDSSTRLSILLLNEIIQDSSSHKLPAIIDELSTKLHSRLKIFKINQGGINKHVLQQLQLKNIYYLSTEKNNINLIYLKINDDYALRIGPIEYPYYSRILFDQLTYFFIITVSIFAFSILLLTLLFNKNIKKLILLTKNYSKGNFKSSVSVSQLSTLKTLHHNIVAMGNSIKNLMETQKNMSKFVVHEIRTPLYTIQLAIDSMKNELDNTALKKVNSDLMSVEDDLEELNLLVESFLIYSQSSSQSFTLNNQVIAIEPWLTSHIQVFKSKFKMITYVNKTTKADLYIQADVKLLAYAINNLLSNAVKFMDTMIEVIIENTDSFVLIHIDDDGPGLSGEDKEKLFNAFSTLSVSSDSQHKHLGLGLEIAMNIITKHNQADLSVQQSPSLRGARFTLSFGLVTIT